MDKFKDQLTLTPRDAEITVRRLRMAGKKRGDKGESPEQRGRDANDQTVSTTSVTNDPLTVEEPPLPSGQQQKSAIDEYETKFHAKKGLVTNIFTGESRKSLLGIRRHNTTHARRITEPTFNAAQ